MTLNNKLVLITGAALRVGRELGLTVARAGGDVVIHYGHSQAEAESLRDEIQTLGRRAYLLQADLNDPAQVGSLIPQACEFGPLFALVNNAAIFETLIPGKAPHCEEWNHHLMVNLTAPFLLSQEFARHPGNRGDGAHCQYARLAGFTSGCRPPAVHHQQVCSRCTHRVTCGSFSTQHHCEWFSPGSHPSTQ